MSRYPLAEIHRKLDEVAAETGASTNRRFSAPIRSWSSAKPRCWRARAGSSRRITALAGCCCRAAIVLDWHSPEPGPRRSGEQIAFLGPTITRQRPDIVRALAEIWNNLIVFGEMLAGRISLGRGGNRPAPGTGLARTTSESSSTRPRSPEPAPARRPPAASGIYATPECRLESIDYLPTRKFPCCRLVGWNYGSCRRNGSFAA